MATANPYRAPAAAVADASSGEEFQDVRLFGVSGRIGRIRYIGYTIGVSILGSALAGVLAAALGTFGAILAFAVYIGMMVLMFTLTIQRAHDFNTTGWLSIVVLIPLVN